jgi:cytochrome b
MLTMDQPAEGRTHNEARLVRVWDPFVRFAHWTIAIGFFLAYFSEDDLLSLHVWAGYTIGVLAVLRVAWGLIGPSHARFEDFIYRPDKVFSYLAQLLTFRAKRHLGHSPAGGAMVLTLLVGLAATVWSGLEVYAIEENAGPLAAIAADAERGPRVLRVNAVEDDEAGPQGRDGKMWEEVHEVSANVMLVLVVLHIAGVMLASFVHRENLTRAMVTGMKRAEDS